MHVHRLPTLKAKIALRLTREERLAYPVVTFSYDAFQLCAAVSDLEHAKAWLRVAYSGAVRIRGPEGAQHYVAWLDNVQQHPAWGVSRQKMVLEGPDRDE